MKKLKYNIIILLISTLIVFFFVLKDDFYGITNILLNSNVWYLIFALIFITISSLFKSMSVYLLVKEVDKSIKLKYAFLLNLKTDFFNNITPFCLGGQPYQLYALKKERKIDYATGTNIVFKDFYAYQLAFITLGVVFFILNLIFKFIIITNVIRKFIILGFIINGLVELFLIYIAYKKNSKHNITNKIIDFLNKIKIIKDKDNAKNRLNNLLDRFKEQINKIKTTPKLMFKCYIFNLLKLLTLGIVAYGCFKAIGVSNVNVTVSMIVIILTMFVASYIPIPGGSGGMELGFFSLFSTYVIGIKLSAALLLWRFISYYLLIICGGLAFALGNRK